LRKNRNVGVAATANGRAVISIVTGTKSAPPARFAARR